MTTSLRRKSRVWILLFLGLGIRLCLGEHGGKNLREYSFQKNELALSYIIFFRAFFFEKKYTRDTVKTYENKVCKSVVSSSNILKTPPTKKNENETWKIIVKKLSINI